MSERRAREVHRPESSGLIVALFVGIVVWHLPSLWYPFEPAHALAQVIAKVILEGGVPYRDALDVKPPAIFYLQAGLMAVAGDHMSSLRVADLLSVCVTMYLMVRFGARIGCGRWGVWAALIFGLAYPLMGFWKTAQAESFLLPWLWWGMLLSIGRSESGDALAYFLCGVCFGVVFWFKYPYVLALPFLVAGQAIPGLRQRGQGKEGLWEAVSMAAGFLCVVGAGGLYLWGIGALEDMWRLTVAQNLGERIHLAAKGTLLKRSAVYWASFREFPLFVLVLVLSVVGSFVLLKERSKGGFVILIHLLCLMTAIEIQVRLYHYHLVPLLSVACFAAGVGIDTLIKAISKACVPAWVFPSRVLTGLALAVLIMAGLANHHEAYRRWWAYVGRGLSWEAYLATFPDLSGRYRPFVLEEWKAGQLLRAMELKQDTLFMWGGFTPLVYYFSGLRPSTPFLYTDFITVPGPWGQLWMRRLEHLLSAKAPGAVVILTSGDLGETLREVARSAPLLYDLLHFSYSLEAKLGPFLVYRRLGEP